MGKGRYQSPGLKKKKREAKFCYYCFRPLICDTNRKNGHHNNNTTTIDHFIPLNFGGSNWQYNKVICCHACNKLKADFTIKEFLQQLNFILQTTYYATHTKQGIKNIIEQVKYIKQNYENNKIKNEPYYLIEIPKKLGLLQQLRLKYMTNENRNQWQNYNCERV